MHQLCQACERAPVEVIDPCDNPDAPYELCRPCHHRLQALSLRPLEWYNLAKGHGWFQFLLHDDFYDEDGEASQPKEDVENGCEFPAPTLEKVVSEPQTLLAYTLTRWRLRQDTVAAWRALPSSVVLATLAERFASTGNAGIRGRILEICGSVLGAGRQIWCGMRGARNFQNVLTSKVLIIPEHRCAYGSPEIRNPGGQPCNRLTRERTGIAEFGMRKGERKASRKSLQELLGGQCEDIAPTKVCDVSGNEIIGAASLGGRGLKCIFEVVETKSPRTPSSGIGGISHARPSQDFVHLDQSFLLTASALEQVVSCCHSMPRNEHFSAHGFAPQDGRCAVGDELRTVQQDIQQDVGVEKDTHCWLSFRAIFRCVEFVSHVLQRLGGGEMYAPL
jgi:hypothetical protein